jgi:diguanylate cyclase (GGDEF)-like protein
LNIENLKTSFLLEWNALEFNNDIIFLICLTIVIVSLTFFLSLLESSILYVDELKVSILKKRKPKRAKVFSAIMKGKKSHLSSMVVLNTIVSIMGSTALGALSSKYFGSFMVAIYSFILTYFILTISKILPKLLSISHALTVFESSAYIIRTLYFITIPMLWTTQIVTYWLTKEQNQINKNQNEEEFYAIIDYYKDKGVIHDTEKSVFERVMKMKNKKANELFNKSVSKFKLENFDITANDLYKQYESTPPRKIFITYKGNVIGVLYNKDVSRAIAYDNGKTKIIHLMRDPIIVSQDENLFEIVHRLNTEEKSVAVVMDNKNNPVGVLTPKVIYRYLLKNVNLLSTIDLDTGVLSRKNFIYKIKETFKLYENDEENSFSIIFLNIQNFSDYNDKYGYHQGDKILKEISKKIKKHIDSDKDILGRLGEGFGIILQNTDKNKAQTVFKNIEKDLHIKNIFLKSAITEYNKNSSIETYLEMIKINNQKMREKQNIQSK